MQDFQGEVIGFVIILIVHRKSQIKPRLQW